MKDPLLHVRHHFTTGALAVLFATGAATHVAAQATVGPRPDYAPAAQALEQFITYQIQDKQLPALSIALVDDQEIVWSRGFGFANPKDSTPATAATVYRVGSVSKLFTDIAVMQLVEQGRLDLDAPVERYLPDFHPRNPFGTPITLRQLMAHRSGLVREPPVGHYFDPTEPTLAHTIASLNGTALVYAPTTRTKYSNAAIATVGFVLERTQGEPFARYVQRAVLEPLGLTHSGFEPTPGLAKDLATAYMWTYDGRVFPAPTFQLGIAPAGSLYTTVTDLGRFLSALFAVSRAPGGLQILKPATLDTMWTPQFAKPDEKTGFGIGFRVGERDGRRTVGHGGAVYGFATTLSALPDDRLGVVVATTLDAANAVTGRIAAEALKAMIAVRSGRPLPEPERTTPVPPEVARRLAGRYVKAERYVELIEREGRLSVLGSRSSSEAELRVRGDTLVVDDRGFSYGQRLLPLPRGNRLVIGADTFTRVPDRRPPPAAERWTGLIGEYGWDHDVLYVLERDGKLWTLIEWFDYYPLEEVGRDTFKFPDRGLYDGETLVFARDASGRATQALAGGAVLFPRRNIEPAEGATQLRITPLRPLEELRREALAARPPEEHGEFRAPDLVELTALDSTIKLEIRYATANNFLGTVLYSEPRAFLQRPAAEALVRAHRALKRLGYGLLIHDAYRPWSVTKVFWDATPADKKWFVANPAQGSKHNRGAAVDLSLHELRTGKPVAMVGTYDETTDRSTAFYPGGTSLQRWQRGLLRRAMEAQGFTVYPAEWWHFDYRDWRRYPIGNAPFEELRRQPR